MKYIECPIIYEPIPGEQAVFLAGGITGCVDWQSKMKDMLSRTDLVVLNPRRAAYDVNDENLHRLQVSWEYEHLRKATAISFWFSPETLCPVTLFEYGKWIVQREKQIFVGCHSNYQKREEIEIQTGLERPNINVHGELVALATAIRNWVARNPVSEAPKPESFLPQTNSKGPQRHWDISEDDEEMLAGVPSETEPKPEGTLNPVIVPRKNSPTPRHKKMMRE